MEPRLSPEQHTDQVLAEAGPSMRGPTRARRERAQCQVAREAEEGPSERPAAMETVVTELEECDIGENGGGSPAVRHCYHGPCRRPPASAGSDFSTTSDLPQLHTVSAEAVGEEGAVIAAFPREATEIVGAAARRP